MAYRTSFETALNITNMLLKIIYSERICSLHFQSPKMYSVLFWLLQNINVFGENRVILSCSNIISVYIRW